LAWCVGGPIGDISTWRDLPVAMSAALGIRNMYFRFRCDRQRIAEDIETLQASGWTFASAPMGTNLTMSLDLSAPPSELLPKFSRSWRRNLKSADAGSLLIERDKVSDFEELARVYAQMARAKGIADIFPASELGNLVKSHPDRCACYTAKDRSGKVVAFRCILLFRNVACDYFAATTDAGRDARASYLLYWRILNDLHDRGIAYFDLGGIDPDGNPGVYRFKHGTCATPVELLGEWDWATSPVFKWMGNRVIAYRSALRDIAAVVSRALPDFRASKR
jgi:hypothetical protein